MNQLIVISSILLIAPISNPLTTQAAEREGFERPRMVLHNKESVRNSAFSTSYHNGKIVEFNAPGASKVETAACDNAGGCGTAANDINAAGTIVGTYSDQYLVSHGFIRERDGRFYSFDAPGAGLGHNLDEGTTAIAINAAGAIVGEYEDANMIYHGFVREPSGSFTTFSAPGAGTAPGSGLGTIANNLNSYGDTAGYYYDNQGIYHGFVRSRDHRIATFDPPGSVHTRVCPRDCLNGFGVIGGYHKKDDVNHGFLREPNGKIIVLDAPGAGRGAYQGTAPYGINAQGTIAGFIIDSNNVFHGFLRYRNGSYRVGEVPGSGQAAYQGTYPLGINAFDAITGYFTDSNNDTHGFERFATGAIARFDAPDAAFAFGGTEPGANNVRGEVAGLYTDKTGLSHGFLWTPW